MSDIQVSTVLRELIAANETDIRDDPRLATWRDNLPKSDEIVPAADNCHR